MSAGFLWSNSPAMPSTRAALAALHGSGIRRRWVPVLATHSMLPFGCGSEPCHAYCWTSPLYCTILATLAAHRQCQWHICSD